MSTSGNPGSDAGRDDSLLELAVPESAADEGQKSTSGRKTRQRSVYLFPAYGFTTALDIARRVEDGGGGTLAEETLAFGMGLSSKGSGFRLKTLAARQFQLTSKQGPTLITTPVAKSILRPISNGDALRGYRKAFLSVPLFHAVAERYRGQRLPDSQTFRNVLEREFFVDRTRVQQAERVLLDSARDTHLLKHTSDGAFLDVAGLGEEEAEDFPGQSPNGSEWAGNSPEEESALRFASHASAPLVNSLTFTIDEISQLEEDEFEQVWKAMGTLVRARRRREQVESAGEEE